MIVPGRIPWFMNHRARASGSSTAYHAVVHVGARSATLKTFSELAYSSTIGTAQH